MHSSATPPQNGQAAPHRTWRRQLRQIPNPTDEVYHSIVRIAFACLCVIACSDGPKTPEQTCFDTADEAASAGRRCGEDYNLNYNAFMAQAAGGSCAKIIAIRDEAALRSTCFKWLETTSCNNIYGGALDPSCENQLLRHLTDAGAD
jgi:hypothetical protein